MAGQTLNPSRRTWKVVFDEVGQVVAGAVAEQNLGFRLTDEDREDLEADVVRGFLRHWRTRFEWGRAAKPEDAIRHALVTVAKSVVPDRVGSYTGAKRRAARRVREGQEQASVLGRFVEFDPSRHDARESADDLALREAVRLRDRIIRRLVELAACQPRREWFSAIEVGAEALTVADLAVRDGITERRARARVDEVLPNLFARDPILSAAVEAAEGNIAEAMHGLCSEVLTRVATAEAAAALTGWVVAVSSVEVPPRVFKVTAPPASLPWRTSAPSPRDLPRAPLGTPPARCPPVQKMDGNFSTTACQGGPGYPSRLPPLAFAGSHRGATGSGDRRDRHSTRSRPARAAPS